MGSQRYPQHSRSTFMHFNRFTPNKYTLFFVCKVKIILFTSILQAGAGRKYNLAFLRRVNRLNWLIHTDNHQLTITSLGR